MSQIKSSQCWAVLSETLSGGLFATPLDTQVASWSHTIGPTWALKQETKFESKSESGISKSLNISHLGNCTRELPIGKRQEHEPQDRLLRLSWQRRCTWKVRLILGLDLLYFRPWPVLVLYVLYLPSLRPGWLNTSMKRTNKASLAQIEIMKRLLR